MARSMDWTLEDDMVDGLFFCATLTGRRGGRNVPTEPKPDMCKLCIYVATCVICNQQYVGQLVKNIIQDGHRTEVY